MMGVLMLNMDSNMYSSLCCRCCCCWSRSLGDFAFKHPQALLSAEPHVTQQELAPSDRLVVLTSDGVTDVLPDDDMLGVAMRALEQVRAQRLGGWWPGCGCCAARLVDACSSAGWEGEAQGAAGWRRSSVPQV